MRNNLCNSSTAVQCMSEENLKDGRDHQLKYQGNVKRLLGRFNPDVNRKQEPKINSKCKIV